MNIDTYTVGVKFDLDKISLRSVNSAMDKLQKNAKLAIRAQMSKADLTKIKGQIKAATKAPVVNVNQPTASVGGTRVGGLSGAIGLGAGLVGANEVKNFFMSSIQLASQFEAKMTDANIILKGTEQQYDALAAKAKELGATTALTASDSAAAIEVLARNGVKYEQIMGGILDSTVNLSLALKSDLAPTADLLTDVTAQFGISAKDAAKAADLLAGATVNSKFGFNDMRLAIAQAGGVAGKVGVEFDDFVVALAATSSAFSSGSDAGTSFKTFLQRLVPTTKPAAAAMDELGLMADYGGSKFFDAAGNMKSMAEITQLLHDAFKGLSEEQKIEAASTIAGTDAMRTMLTLAGTTGAEINKLAESIDNVSTAEMRLAKENTFEQKAKRMQSAWEALKLSIIDENMLSFLGDVTEALTAMINTLKNAGGVFKIGESISKEIKASGSLFTGVQNFMSTSGQSSKQRDETIRADANLKRIANKYQGSKPEKSSGGLFGFAEEMGKKFFGSPAKSVSQSVTTTNSGNTTNNININGGDTGEIRRVVGNAVGASARNDSRSATGLHALGGF